MLGRLVNGQYCLTLDFDETKRFMRLKRRHHFSSESLFFNWLLDIADGTSRANELHEASWKVTLEQSTGTQRNIHRRRSTKKTKDQLTNGVEKTIERSKCEVVSPQSSIIPDTASIISDEKNEDSRCEITAIYLSELLENDGKKLYKNISEKQKHFAANKHFEGNKAKAGLWKAKQDFPGFTTTEMGLKEHESVPLGLVCKVCSKTFNTKRSHYFHCKRAHRTATNLCSICEKKFVSAQGARIHQETVHEKSLQVQCLKCKKMFSSQYHLKVHLREVHEDLKPYLCTKCPKTFNRKSHCIQHTKMVHESSKTFKCTVCNKFYKSKSGLRKHIKEIHEESQQHECPVCKKRFNRTEDCHAHERIHTGEKPEKCMFCGKEFNNRRNRWTHEKTHVNNKGPQVSNATFAQQPRFGDNENMARMQQVIVIQPIEQPKVELLPVVDEEAVDRIDLTESIHSVGTDEYIQPTVILSNPTKTSLTLSEESVQVDAGPSNMEETLVLSDLNNLDTLLSEDVDSKPQLTHNISAI